MTMELVRNCSLSHVLPLRSEAGKVYDEVSIERR